MLRQRLKQIPFVIVFPETCPEDGQRPEEGEAGQEVAVGAGIGLEGHAVAAVHGGAAPAAGSAELIGVTLSPGRCPRPSGGSVRGDEGEFVRLRPSPRLVRKEVTTRRTSSIAFCWKTCRKTKSFGEPAQVTVRVHVI